MPISMAVSTKPVYPIVRYVHSPQRSFFVVVSCFVIDVSGLISHVPVKDVLCVMTCEGDTKHCTQCITESRIKRPVSDTHPHTHTHTRTQPPTKSPDS